MLMVLTIFRNIVQSHIYEQNHHVNEIRILFVSCVLIATSETMATVRKLNAECFFFFFYKVASLGLFVFRLHRMKQNKSNKQANKKVS